MKGCMYSGHDVSITGGRIIKNRREGGQEGDRKGMRQDRREVGKERGSRIGYSQNQRTGGMHDRGNERQKG